MTTADLVIFGTVLTVDDLQPTAGALAVSDGRIIAVGDRSDIESWSDADDVVDAIRREVAIRGTQGAYLNGWDPLLQEGLPEPTLDWLNGVAPDTPLVIIHNSGHNCAVARL